MVKMWKVYKIHRIAQPPNVAYIGLSLDPKDRMSKQAHDARKEVNRPLPMAIKEFGKCAFELIILEEHETEEVASVREAELIVEHQTHVSQGGYNMTWDGKQEFKKGNILSSLAGKRSGEIKMVRANERAAIDPRYAKHIARRRAARSRRRANRTSVREIHV